MQGWKLDGAEIGDLPPRWLQALKCYLEKYYKLFFVIFAESFLVLVGPITERWLPPPKKN